MRESELKASGVHFNDDIATLILSFIAPVEIYVPPVTMLYFPVWVVDTRHVSEVAHFLHRYWKPNTREGMAQDISDTSLHRTDVRDPSHLIQRRVFIPRNWNRRIEGGPNHDWPSLYVTKLESSDGYFRRKKVIVMIEPSTEQTNVKIECDRCICVCICMKRALKN